MIRYLKIMVFVFVGCLSAKCKYLANSQDENINKVKSYYLKVNKSDTLNLGVIVSNDFIKINNDKIFDKTGVELLKESIINHKQSNSEYEFVINDIFSERNKVAVRWTWKSINIKSGVEKPVISKGISIFEIENGKIVKLWQSFDLLSFTKQLK